MSEHSVEEITEVWFGVDLKKIYVIVPANQNFGVGVD